MITDITLDDEDWECKSKCGKYGNNKNSKCYTKRGNEQMCDGKNILKLVPVGLYNPHFNSN